MKHIAKSQSFQLSVAIAVFSVSAYIATYRCGALNWLILGFANLVVAICFLMIFARSIIFWILNEQEHHWPFVPFCINILTLLILWGLPPTDHCKYYPKGAYSLAERLGPKNGAGLYIESYLIFGGGAGATDLNAIYLTDLKNFRIFLGVFDEYYDSVNLEREDDLIVVNKKTRDDTNMQAMDWKRKWTKVYSLKTLKAKHVFE